MAPSESLPELEEFAQHIQFVGDNLHITDPEMLRRLDRNRWSASGMKAIESCPARWAMEKLLPDDQSPMDPAPIGTAAHKVMEVLYHCPPTERTKAKASEILQTLELDYPDEIIAPADEGDLMKWRAAIMGKVSPLWKIEDPRKVKVVACEQRLELTVAGVPMIGFIDRTDEVDAGLKIVDYKSGKSSNINSRRKYGDPHGDQLRLYNEAIAERDGKPVAEAWIYYTGAGESYAADLSKEHTDRVVEEFRSTWKIMKESARTGRYSTCASTLCGWCPLATVCPTAREAGKDEAKIGTATTGAHLGIRSIPNPTTTETQTRKVPRKMTTFPNETRPYDETADNSNQLNPSSYAAIGVCGTTSLAVEVLFAAKQPAKPSLIKALTKTFAHIILSAQEQLSESNRRSWQDGLNSRIRGAMRTVLDLEPPPFGQDEAAWSEWVGRTIKRTTIITSVAYEVWDEGPGEEPWKALVGTTTAPPV